MRRRRSIRRGRSGRNAPWGLTTSAEERHAGNPRSRGRATVGEVSRGKSGVLLGSLVEVQVDTPQHTLTAGTSRLRGLYLAWMPDQRALAIVRKSSARPGRLGPEAVRVHKLFHNVGPSTAASYELPERGGQVKRVGLLRSLTYMIPKTLRSPEKTGYKWVHAFGDHGEEGHGALRGEKQYSDSLKPMLLENRKGELFIQRRPGNKFDVTKWIYW